MKMLGPLANAARRFGRPAPRLLMLAGTIVPLWVPLWVPLLAPGRPAAAATLQLEDGSTLSGRLGKVAGVAEDPFEAGREPAEGVAVTPIVVVDDGLRRTFLPKTLVRQVIDEAEQRMVRVRVWQNVAEHGSSIGQVGEAIRISPIDEFGRRTFEMPTAEGPIAVVQGITMITPVYTRLQGIVTQPRSYIWDQRLATSSLPREVLSRVLNHASPQNDLDARLQIVRLYLQAERYQDARRELEQVEKDFAGDPAVKAEGFAADVRQLRQLAAKRLLDEIELRRDAGQHRLVRSLLERFPADGVAGETLQRVREMLDAADRADSERGVLLERLAATAEGIAEPGARGVAARIIDEVRRHLGEATSDRFASFRRLAEGEGIAADRLAAVAISGWLMGSSKADDNLPVALSLVRARDNVRLYLAETDPAKRESLLDAIRDAPGVSVERVAALLAAMEPPLPLQDPGSPGGDTAEGQADARRRPPEALQSGEEGEATGKDSVRPPLPAHCHRRSVTAGDRTVEYLVQLPPEYDPLRRYPAIVALRPLGAPTTAMVDFWAGAPVATEGSPGGVRAGQAMRRGYVVLAIDWPAEDQLRYEHSSGEHGAVLAAIRDAMRRVSIDSDRVFLTGHGEGGDAAWDIALAHPDHWAGVLPFLARADRYVVWYTENAEHLPWRLVFGELDAGKVAHNGPELDRYLRPGRDAVVVEYRGRGYDPLGDELQRAMEWMARRKRAAPPDSFECKSFRPWDNYFWWLEAGGFAERAIVAPAAWPPKRGVRPTPLQGRRLSPNKLRVNARVDRVTVWLAPDLVDFSQPIEVEWNGRRLTNRGALIEPDLAVLLEDARTRGDRSRPYWAKVSSF